MKTHLPTMLIMFSQFTMAQSNDSAVARILFNEALTKGKSYEMLDHLCNHIGGRLSGSAQAAKAVEWSKKIMEEFGFDEVRLQEVMVPHWVRGTKAMGSIIDPVAGNTKVPVCALGGSVKTQKGGITAGVVEVHDFKELEALGVEKIKGKFVFYNRPMDPTKIETGSAYGDAVNQRHEGAKYAAKYGAVGAIVRSVTLSLDDEPHTGSMEYDSAGIKLPAAAISTIGANLLSGLLKKNPEVKFHLELDCETLPDVRSYNVVGEIKGAQFPEEIILVGGHLDSWDLGQGAHDDGAGCVQSIEALRLFKALGIKPKRTLRAVLFMNEENGLNGAREYAKQAKENKEKHLAAIESDAGGFAPRGFGIKANDTVVKKIEGWKPLFVDYHINEIGRGWGGADISLLEDQGVCLIGYLPETQRYFDYHHAGTDTFDKVNKRELELGSAAMAVLVYLISEYGL